MEELYITPELQLVCFAPVQHLASTDPLVVGLSVELEGGVGTETSGDTDNDLGLDLI